MEMKGNKVTYIVVCILLLITSLFFIGKSMLPGDDAAVIKSNGSYPEGKILKVNSNIMTEDTTEEIDYMQLHDEAYVVDTHNDFVYQVFERGAVFGKDNSFTDSDLPKFRAGGLDVQVFAVWIPMSKVKRSFDFTMSQIERLKGFERDYPGDIKFAKKYDDIIRIVEEGKICGLIGIEGGTAVEELNDVDIFYENGVRYIGLTWNNSNLLATSARDETERGVAGGLTDFGKEVVKRMNEVGILVDVSHLGEASFWDVVEISDKPILASHSNSYTIYPHYRNLTDEQIKAIAKSGGVIQVNFHKSFLGEASLQRVFEHIDYIKNLVGVDHIGIGADFDGGITPPYDLNNATEYPALTQKLVEEGYSKEEIKKILGLNFLRVFKQVCG